MNIVWHDFLGGFIFGGIATMAIATLAEWRNNREARKRD